VAGSCEYGEPSGSGATELVSGQVVQLREAHFRRQESARAMCYALRDCCPF
jgi:hypothetical protein